VCQMKIKNILEKKFGRSVGIVRSRTQTMEFVFFFVLVKKLGIK
jgi:hypothetical protein